MFYTWCIRSGNQYPWGSARRQLQMPHFDVDKFYWLSTEPPFTTSRPGWVRREMRRLSEETPTSGWPEAWQFSR